MSEILSLSFWLVIIRQKEIAIGGDYNYYNYNYIYNYIYKEERKESMMMKKL